MRRPLRVFRATTRSIALFLAVALNLAANQGQSVRIFGESGLALATIQAPAGFTLSFMHSINLSPVDEHFIVDAEGFLVLDRVEFNQLSTGMPSGDEDGFAVENGRFVTRPFRRIPKLAVRVSPVPGHELGVAGRRIPLTRWAPPGGLLYFEAGSHREP